MMLLNFVRYYPAVPCLMSFQNCISKHQPKGLSDPPPPPFQNYVAVALLTADANHNFLPTSDVVVSFPS